MGLRGVMKSAFLTFFFLMSQARACQICFKGYISILEPQCVDSVYVSQGKQLMQHVCNPSMLFVITFFYLNSKGCCQAIRNSCESVYAVQVILSLKNARQQMCVEGLQAGD